MLIRRRVRPRNRPLLHLVPNLFTILGLCAGLTAIRYALDQRWELAVALVIVAGIFDGLDGRSARMLKITSKLGAELDSLADFLSFGVAPAVIVYLWSLNDVRGVGWALAMLFATCCALRLARFNSELEQPDRPRWTLYFFTGIPAPAAAGLALLPMMLSFSTGLSFAASWTLNAILFLFVACMMVSRVPTFSVKRLRVRPDLVLPTLVGAGLLIVLLVTEPWSTLTGVGIVYLLSLPASYLVARRMRLREEAQRAAAAEADAAGASTPELGPSRIIAIDSRTPRSP
ncbi:MAG: CDP-diacylglycerol--serine O-phosphatidyltransferase [Geminicoccaceae bacterium]